MSSSFYDYTCHEQRECNFLRACFMCHKQLGMDHDIFMYKGDTPFCSEECRRKQIQMDDHSRKKKSWITLKRAPEGSPPERNVYKK